MKASDRHELSKSGKSDTLYSSMTTAPVEAVDWNPRRPPTQDRLGRLLHLRRRSNHFRVLLGTIIVGAALRAWNRGETQTTKRRLTAVGPVRHVAQDADVWDAGANRETLWEQDHARSVEVRALREPHTGRSLDERNLQATDACGDLGLLVPTPSPEVRQRARLKAQEYSAVLGRREDHDLRRRDGVLSPTQPVDACPKRIVRGELVVGSSLSGISVAEAREVDAVLTSALTEPWFKSADCYKGTGRFEFTFVSPIGHTFHTEPIEALDLDLKPLLNVFPTDRWNRLKRTSRRTKKAVVQT